MSSYYGTIKSPVQALGLYWGVLSIFGGLHSEGLIFGGLIIGGPFGLTDELCMPNTSQYKVQEALITTFNAQNFPKEYK